MNGGKLVPNNKLEYKVFEYGNFPLLQKNKPRGGVYRMSLPSEGDWTGAETRLDEIRKRDDIEDDVLNMLKKKYK